jgi:hypothetical protein
LQHPEEPGRDAEHVVVLGRDVFFAEDGSFARAGFEASERMGMGAVIEEIGPGEGHALAIAAIGFEIAGGDGDEAFAVGDGHGFEQGGVNEGEDHGDEADTQSDGDDNGGGEPTVRGDQAQREPEIVGHTG